MVNMKEIAKRPKSQLLTMIEELMNQRDAMNKAVNNRFYDCEGKCVAVPLTRDELYAVEDEAKNFTCEQAGNGKRLSTELDSEDGREQDFTEELILNFAYCTREKLLPQFAGLVIHSRYESINGCDVIGVWGLLSVK